MRPFFLLRRYRSAPSGVDRNTFDEIGRGWFKDAAQRRRQSK